MDKLFESRKVLAANSAIPEVDAEIILTRAPFVQYEQILQDKNLGQHLETIMVSKKILRMGAQKTPIQKTYEIQKGSDSLNVEFLEQTGSSIGQKYLSCQTKATNIRPYTTATTGKQQRS